MARAKPGSETNVGIVGEVQVLPLEEVSPNPWNPYRMTPAMLASLEHGLRVDGWVAAQALLVWGSDEAGNPPPGGRKLVIDGEHRWRAARAIGMREGPMVVLEGLSADEARAMTIKFNQKRGDPDLDLLASLVAELSERTELGAVDLGFSEAELAALLAAGSEVAPPEPEPEGDPAPFGKLDERTLPIEHECPSCRYRWSGPSGPRDA